MTPQPTMLSEPLCTAPSLEETTRRLLDSEIPFEVSAFTVSHLRVRLGDPMNGFLAERSVLTPEEAAAFLAITAAQHFPQSDFALDERAKRSKRLAATCQSDGESLPSA
jgi:hypothetical protein